VVKSIFTVVKNQFSTVVKINFFFTVTRARNFRAGYACRCNALIWLVSIRSKSFLAGLFSTVVKINFFPCDTRNFRAGYACRGIALIWLVSIRGIACFGRLVVKINFFPCGTHNFGAGYACSRKALIWLVGIRGKTCFGGQLYCEAKGQSAVTSMARFLVL